MPACILVCLQKWKFSSNGHNCPKMHQINAAWWAAENLAQSFLNILKITAKFRWHLFRPCWWQSGTRSPWRPIYNPVQCCASRHDCGSWTSRHQPGHRRLCNVAGEKTSGVTETCVQYLQDEGVDWNNPAMFFGHFKLNCWLCVYSRRFFSKVYSCGTYSPTQCINVHIK